MRNLRCGLAAAALWMFLVSEPALAQTSLVVGETGDPGFLNSLPTPVSADVFTGPLVGQFPNARLTGSAIGLERDEVAIVDNAQLPFSLQVFPPAPDGSARVVFDVGGKVIEKIVPAPAADEIYAADGLFVIATSGGPGMIVQANNLNLDVPTGRAGPVASVPEANGTSTEFAVVSLGCVSYELGFTLRGFIVFAGTPEAPITDFPGSVQIRLSSTGTSCEEDNDFDGEPNSSDNCPSTANPGQENADGDSKGNVCDECPEDPRPSEDLDGDGFGVLCDNCPLGCVLQDPDGNCRNEDQKNSDEDRFGDICDNCFDVTNEPVCCAEIDPLNPRTCVPILPEVSCNVDADCTMGANRCLQADSDGDGEGDACTSSGLLAEAVVVDEPDALFQLAPVTSAAGTSVFNLFVRCGVRSLSAANVPFRIPSLVTSVVFGTCGPPEATDDQRRSTCGACATPGPPGPPSNGCGLGESVDPAQSLTRGLQIANPAAVADDIFVISLVGNLPEGAEGNRLCRSSDVDSRFLGTLTLTGLDSTDPNQPSIVSDSLNLYTIDDQARCEPAGGPNDLPDPGDPSDPTNPGDPLCTLLSTVDAGREPVPVPTNLTTTSVINDSNVTVEVRPAIGEETDVAARIERFQVTVSTPPLPDGTPRSIARIAIGLQGFRDMGPDGAIFANCTLPVTIDPPGEAPPYQVFGCPDSTRDGNVEIGPRVEGGIDGDDIIPFSYVVYPGTPGAPTPPETPEVPGVAPDTVYVVFTEDGQGINPTPDTPALLGVFEYQPGGPANLPQPVVVTQGVNEFFDPEFENLDRLIQEAVVFLDSNVPPETNVSSVGGVGSTPNRDTDSLADENDNCVEVGNQDQLDEGRFLAESEDGIGNVCQCGNSSNLRPGAIFDEDLQECILLLGTGNTAPQSARRCSVSGTNVVDILDLTTLDLAINVEGVCRTDSDQPSSASEDGEDACMTDADCAAPERCFDKVRVSQECEQAGS